MLGLGLGKILGNGLRHGILGVGLAMAILALDLLGVGVKIGRDRIMNDTLTKEQVDNWRKVLCGMIGPYAMIMSENEIQLMRDNFQGIADKEKSEVELT